MNKTLGIVLVVALIIAGISLWSNKFQKEVTQGEYSPVINAEDFSMVVDNPYFTLTPKTEFVYEGETEDGREKIEFYVTEETKMVMGVETVVVWDRVWLDGELIEETKDWYAQDKEGNVWYFGEETYEFEDGEIISTDGAWEAGVGGAKPGIIMPANPKIGQKYKEEYYKGEAEDEAEVLSLSETVTVPYGSFTGCLKTKNYTRLEPSAIEHKIYCREVGGVVLEINPVSNERVELISLERNAKPAP